MKDTPITHHIMGVKGRKNAQALDSWVLTGATTTRPDSIYGCVKSAFLVRSVVIETSPTMASNTYMK